MADLKQIKKRIIDRLDPEELTDRLNISIEHLVEALGNDIEDNLEAFYDLED